MKYIIFGLGNIGQEYAATRHNIGFMVADALAKQEGASFDIDKHAFVTEIKYKGRSILLVKPTTYMNASGKAVNYWLTTQKVPVENSLVLVDELALPFGTLRMRGQGSHAGHNGLKDIEAVLGNNNYPRLRFGIGNDYPKGRQVDYVLGEFTKDEQIELPQLIEKASAMVLSFCTAGLSMTMNQYNK